MDAFVGELRLFPYQFVPLNWALCDGTLIPVQANQSLYAVIGNLYGGTPGFNFALPDLRARALVCAGDDPVDDFDPMVAQHGGANAVALTTAHMPPHIHNYQGAQSTLAVRVQEPTGNLQTGIYFKGNPSGTVAAFGYTQDPAPSPVQLNPATLTPFVGSGSGTGNPHENRQPFLAMRWCICTEGYFPTPP